jgi:hypothetical protein
MPLMTVSPAVITVLHSGEVVHVTHDHNNNKGDKNNAVRDFAVRTRNLENIYKKVPSLKKIHKNSSKTPKIHIFLTTTPNQVILVPKFSESLPLSFCAFI